MSQKIWIPCLIVFLVLAAALPTRGTNRGQAPGPGKIVNDVEMTDVFADHCRIWIRITNKGNVKIDKVLREQVWVDGILKDDSKTHYILEPGAVFAHGVGAEPGLKITGLNHKVRAFVDAENVLAEINEANNSKEVTLSCRLTATPSSIEPVVAKPDLIVSFNFKNVIRKDPNADGHYVYTADIEFTVTNQGAGNAGPCLIRLEKDSGPGGSFEQAGPEISIPAVNAGQSVTKVSTSYQHTGPAPTYRATVDSHNTVAETNEGNNIFIKKFPY